MLQHHSGMPNQKCQTIVIDVPPSECRTRRQNLGRFTPGMHRGSAQSHVLVVHDHPDTLEMIAEMFRKLRYRVITASDRDEALLHLGQRHFDLVFFDLDMQLIDGYYLARWIKKQNSKTKVVIMTARCQAEIVTLMGDGTIDGWLFKPFKTRTLSDLLADVGLIPSCCHANSGSRDHHKKSSHLNRCWG